MTMKTVSGMIILELSRFETGFDEKSAKHLEPLKMKIYP